MYTKKSPRVTFKSNRRSNFRRNNNYSNGKIRNKGNVSQQYNKYLKLAKEASSSGDRIQSEYYYQFTDHYYRLMVEMGINIEDSDLNLESKSAFYNIPFKKIPFYNGHPWFLPVAIEYYKLQDWWVNSKEG